MTLKDISEIIKKQGGYTQEIFDSIDKVIEESNWDSYKDPDIMYFFRTVTDLDRDDRVQTAINKIVNKMYDKGIQPPCMSGCDPECPFKSLED